MQINDSSRIDFFPEMITVIARIAALTPNSADCGRVISANNNLKTNKRASLLVSTENDYLYIHFNIPPLEKWNPRPAVTHYIAELNRRKSHRTVEDERTTQQPYFNHIFGNIREQNEDVIESLQSFSF